MRRKILTVVLICFAGVFIFGLIRILPPTMWNFLVVNETLELSDVIIVLEGPNGRIEHGVNLLRLGYAKKILFTGGAGAHNMAEQAVSLGVSDANILIEDRSGTTFGNAKNSLEIMRTQGFRSAIIVTAPPHTRRTSIIFNELFREFSIIVSSAPYDSKTANDWWKDKKTANFVISEYLKLVYHYMFEKWGISLLH